VEEQLVKAARALLGISGSRNIPLCDLIEMIYGPTEAEAIMKICEMEVIAKINLENRVTH
jgi:hypothetical protein